MKVDVKIYKKNHLKQHLKRIYSIDKEYLYMEE